MKTHFAKSEEKYLANIIDLGLKFYLFSLGIFILPNPTDPQSVKFRSYRGNRRALSEFATIKDVTWYGRENPARFFQDKAACGVVPHSLASVQIKLHSSRSDPAPLQHGRPQIPLGPIRGIPDERVCQSGNKTLVVHVGHAFA